MQSTIQSRRRRKIYVSYQVCAERREQNDILYDFDIQVRYLSDHTRITLYVKNKATVKHAEDIHGSHGLYCCTIRYRPREQYSRYLGTYLARATPSLDTVVTSYSNVDRCVPLDFEIAPNLGVQFVCASEKESTIFLETRSLAEGSSAHIRHYYG